MSQGGSRSGIGEASGKTYEVTLRSLGELLLGGVSQIRVYCRSSVTRQSTRAVSRRVARGPGRAVGRRGEGSHEPGDSEFASTWLISELDMVADLDAARHAASDRKSPARVQSMKWRQTRGGSGPARRKRSRVSGGACSQATATESLWKAETAGGAG